MKKIFVADKLGNQGTLIESDTTYRRDTFEVCRVFLIVKPQKFKKEEPCETPRKPKNSVLEAPKIRLKMLSSRDFL